MGVGIGSGVDGTDVGIIGTGFGVTAGGKGAGETVVGGTGVDVGSVITRVRVGTAVVGTAVGTGETANTLLGAGVNAPRVGGCVIVAGGMVGVGVITTSVGIGVSSAGEGSNVMEIGVGSTVSAAGVGTGVDGISAGRVVHIWRHESNQTRNKMGIWGESATSLPTDW